MRSSDFIPGFYGKLPVAGDFVARRLPLFFLKPWDDWLQRVVFFSKQRFGDKFRDSFLAGPVWRFVLGSGSCGHHSVAGILAPSTDRVGRCFPLTLAIAAEGSLPHLLVRAQQWFATLEILMDRLQNDKYDLEEFDQALQQQALPGSLVNDVAGLVKKNIPPPANPLFMQLEMSADHSIQDAFEYLNTYMLQHYLYGYSLWSTNARGQGGTPLLVFRGLPPPDGFVRFFESSRLNQ